MAVRTQVNDRAQLINLLQVLTPTAIKNLKQDLFFNQTELPFRGKLGLFIIRRFRRFMDSLGDFDICDAFFGGPVCER